MPTKLPPRLIHFHVREGLNVVLLRRAGIGDVDPEQRNVGIGCHHLIQGARHRFGWGAPACMEIDETGQTSKY